MTTVRDPLSSPAAGLRLGPEVSIIIPVYNEEESLPLLCASIRDALHGWPYSYEVLLIDDGSTDGTIDRSREEMRRDPRIRVLRFPVNQGQTAAMACGFRRARGRILVTLDADLQNDPRDIPLLVERLEEGYGMVCGWRKDRHDSFTRTLPSKIANRLIAWTAGTQIRDTGCTLKAYRLEVVRALRLYSEMHRFLPALASMTGARISEVVVRHHPRRHGRSKYGISRTVKVLIDLLMIKMVTQFASRPGSWFGLLALPWLILGILASLYWGIRLIGGVQSLIVAPTLAILFFYMFGHMMMLSVLSEMLLAYGDRRFLRRIAEALSVQDRVESQEEEEVS
ncbi:MAG: glycosyltransferase family 2 protein [Candidatus Eisenbacteria bacterium]|nr:glycosyltransferase family 2 protein [Candidatus Eisenbacteria bacterium]